MNDEAPVSNESATKTKHHELSEDHLDQTNMDTELMVKDQCDYVTGSVLEMERLRQFIKHLSFIPEQSNRNYNLSRAVIAEIDTFPVHICTQSTNTKYIETAESNMKQNRIAEGLDFLRDIVHNLTDRIMRRVKLHQIQKLKIFSNPQDQQQFEDIFMSSLRMNVPFDIGAVIAEYAVGEIKECVNPHRKKKELLILNGNKHKEWFPCDYPANAIVCGRCFVKYVKQCDGCGLIVLSNVINSITMDGKWYCGRSLRCVLGFGGDYRT